MSFSNEDLFVILIAGLVLTLILFVVDLQSASGPVSRRAKKIALTERKQDNPQQASISNDADEERGKKVHQILKGLNLANREVQEPIRIKLLSAGLRGKHAVEMFLFAKLAGPFVVGGAGYAMLVGGFFGDLPTNQMMIFGALAVLGGYMVPEIYVSNLKAKRAKNIQLSLPDGLDLMVICAEAGLSLDSTLNRVAGELAPSGPELAEELSVTAVELSFLPNRRQALLNLSSRVASKAMQSVVNTLLQTEKYGTPLTQSLRVLSAEFREERMLKAEEKAARLPAILTVPMIVFILPTLFIVLIGPAILDVYDQFVNR